jgi:hypothetical protein
VAQQLRGLASI